MELPESVIIQLATLSEQDRAMIQKCRGKHNRLGFAYQLLFVKVFNHFPNQILLEIQPQILTFALLQLGIKTEFINPYQKRQQTFWEHQRKIRNYLNLAGFDKAAIEQVNSFLFIEAQRTEHTSILDHRNSMFKSSKKAFILSYVCQQGRNTKEALTISRPAKIFVIHG